MPRLRELSEHELGASVRAGVVSVLILKMPDIVSRAGRDRFEDEEKDMRVEDFLNDKLQNSTDLANIDALLEDVKAQQGLLLQQVSLPFSCCGGL